MVYGCNALYRDYCPHRLIAVDDKMLKEIDRNKVQDTIPVWTYHRKKRENKNFNFFDANLGWSSGPSALRLAVLEECKRIYILGFDYSGIHKQINNLYAGTENYRDSDSRATYYRNWLWQTQKVITDNQEVQFVRVIDRNCLQPDSFHECMNIQHESVEKFQYRVQNMHF